MLNLENRLSDIICQLTNVVDYMASDITEYDPAVLSELLRAKEKLEEAYKKTTYSVVFLCGVNRSIKTFPHISDSLIQ